MAKMWRGFRREIPESSADFLDQIGQPGQVIQCSIARGVRRLGMFQVPRQIVRNENAPSANLDRRDHIGFHRIPHHHRPRGAAGGSAENPRIGRRAFVRDDLDRVKQLSQPRLRQFAFLMQQVTLGDQYKVMSLGHRRDGLPCVGQQLHRMIQHVAPGLQQLRDHRGGDPPLGHLDGGFDHRQGKPLHAKAIVPNIAPLGLQQPGIQMRALGVIGQQFGESLLRQMKESFVMPERIIRIEANCLQFLRHSAPLRLGPLFPDA